MAGWEGLTSCPAKKYIFFETNWGNTVHIQCKAGRGDDMEDEEIIELFWSRDEEAVTSVQAGYGKMCAQVRMYGSASTMSGWHCGIGFIRNVHGSCPLIFGGLRGISR